MRYLTAIVTASAIGCFSLTAEAGRLDTYKQIMQNGQYTIKFTETIFSVAKKNRDVIRVGTQSLKYTMDYYSQKTKINKGYVVASNGKCYSEYTVGLEPSKNLPDTLTMLFYHPKDQAVFCRYNAGDIHHSCIKDKQMESRSGQDIHSGNRQLGLNDVDNRKATGYGQYYTEGSSAWAFDTGSEEVDTLLSALAGKGNKMFREVNSGQGADGLFYEDYRFDGENEFKVIRWYFDGNKLVSGALAAYYTNDSGEWDGKNCILDFDEFSSTVDTKALSKGEKMDAYAQKKFGGKSND